MKGDVIINNGLLFEIGFVIFCVNKGVCCWWVKVIIDSGCFIGIKWFRKCCESGNEFILVFLRLIIMVLLFDKNVMVLFIFVCYCLLNKLLLIVR